MTAEEIAIFFETDTFSVTLTPQGLQYLSLRNNQGARLIKIKLVEQEKQDPEIKLLFDETRTFLKTGKHNMPLDLSALTSFQQSVFQVVSEVEPGTVTTYGAIAETLGKPGAARAVGSAVTKNPVSFFLPTHRVLPQKGIAICRTGAGHLREKLLAHEGHDLSRLRGNYICTRKNCRLE